MRLGSVLRLGRVVERILLPEERAHRIAEARVRGVERPGEKDRIRLAPTEDLLPVELILAEVVEDDGVFQLLRVPLRGNGIVGEVEAQRESDRRQRDSRGRESQRDLPRVIRVDEAVREVRTRVEVEGREPIEVLACEHDEAVVQVEGACLLLLGYVGRDERIAVLEAQRLIEEPLATASHASRLPTPGGAGKR